MDNERDFKWLSTRLGIVLIINTALLFILTLVTQSVHELFRIGQFEFNMFPASDPSDVEYAVFATVDMAAYLLSFMFPVAVFRWLTRGRINEPMRLYGGIGRHTFPLIVLSVGAIVAVSYVNSLAVSFIDFSSVFETDSPDTATKLIVQVISTALVPAFCEEFLFRGCVLSNLLPYGKTTAVVGSALLFALMHGNPAQYLYTAAAGVALGLLYLYSGSIWLPTATHFINNFNAVMSSYLLSALGERRGTAVVYIIDTALVLAALASAAYLAVRRRGIKDGINLARESDVAVPTRRVMPDIPTNSKIKLFMCPAMTVYFIMSLCESALVLIAVLTA